MAAAARRRAGEVRRRGARGVGEAADRPLHILVAAGHRPARDRSGRGVLACLRQPLPPTQPAREGHIRRDGDQPQRSLTLIRHTAGTITAMTAIAFVVPPSWWRCPRPGRTPP